MVYPLSYMSRKANEILVAPSLRRGLGMSSSYLCLSSLTEGHKTNDLRHSNPDTKPYPRKTFYIQSHKTDSPALSFEPKEACTGAQSECKPFAGTCIEQAVLSIFHYPHDTRLTQLLQLMKMLNSIRNRTRNTVCKETSHPLGLSLTAWGSAGARICMRKVSDLTHCIVVDLTWAKSPACNIWSALKIGLEVFEMF